MDCYPLLFTGIINLLLVKVSLNNPPGLVQVHYVVETMSQDLSMQMGNLSMADACIG